MKSWFENFKRRVQFEEPKSALVGAIARHLSLCRGTLSILYIGDIEDHAAPPPNVPEFWFPLPQTQVKGKPQIPDPEDEFEAKSDKLLVYAPIALFPQWTAMSEDVDRFLGGRRQVTVVMILPGFARERVMDFRWILSALLDRLPVRRYNVMLTFFPDDVKWDVRRGIIDMLSTPFFLTRAKRMVRWVAETMRAALSYDSVAGVRGDPYRFAALLISIRRKT